MACACHRQTIAIAIVWAILPWASARAAPPSAETPAVSVEYTTRLTPIYSDAALTRRIGTLFPGNRLDLTNGTGPSAGRAFSIEGWFQQGNTSSLFLQEGKRILIATLAHAPMKRARLGRMKDGYGNEWTRARVQAYLDPSTLTDDQDTVWRHAAKLYQTRCSACHAVHKPTEFTANQWPGILKIMAKNAALQPADLALITEYLQTHARP